MNTPITLLSWKRCRHHSGNMGWSWDNIGRR